MKIPSAWFSGPGTAAPLRASPRAGAGLAARVLVAAMLPAGCSSAPTGSDSAIPVIVNHAEILQARRHEYRTTGMMERGVGDTTGVQILVDTLGRVSDAKVAVSSEDQTVDEAALRVARVHQFEPARNRGKAVPVWVSLSLSFVPGLCDVPPQPTRVFFMERLNTKGRRGETTVAVFVDERGVVWEARVQTSSGWDVFDQAALEAARKFRYRPGMTNCEPAEKWTTMMYSMGRRHSGT